MIRESAIAICSLFAISCVSPTVTSQTFQPESYFHFGEKSYINYVEYGHGSRTFIFIHGFGASHRTWDDLLPLLEIENAKIVLVDLLGSGFSSKISEDEYTMHNNAEIITKLIKEKDFQKITIVGHSYGGGVGLLTAINFLDQPQNRIHSMVLLDAAAYNTKLPFFVSYLRNPILGELIFTFTSSAYRARFTLESVFYKKDNVSKDQVNRYAYFLDMPGSNEALVSTAENIIPSDYKQSINRYGELKMPTLIICGENDPALPLTSGIKLNEDLPNSKLFVVKQCGHNPHEECSVVTAKEINAFITETK